MKGEFVSPEQALEILVNLTAQLPLLRADQNVCLQALATVDQSIKELASLKKIDKLAPPKAALVPEKKKA